MQSHPTRRRHPQRSAPLMLATLAAVLAACGGDDGTPPLITAQPTSITAAEGGRAQAAVTATSDSGDIGYQWLDPDTLNDLPGAAASTLDAGPVSITWQGRRFQARLTNLVGSVLSDIGTLSVTERGWSTAEPVVASNARQFASIVDSNGHTHLLVINGNNLAAGVTARVKFAGSDSTQAAAFTLPTGGDLQTSASLSPVSTSVSLAANTQGYVMAVWHRNGIVGAALYTPGPDATTPGSWTLAPTRINSFVANSALDPAVAAVGNDAFEIAWRERVAPSLVHDVMVRRYIISTNSLGSPELVEALSADTEAPRMVADAAGNVLVAFRLAGGTTVINRRLASATWSTATTVVDGSNMFFEALRTNAQGKAVLLTSNRVGNASAARLDLAAADPVLQPSAAVANAYGSSPDAVVAADGSIHLFGVSVNTGGGNVSRLFRWVCSPNGTWGSAEAVSDINPADFISTGQGVVSPRVSEPDAEGSFIVAWQDRVAAGDAPLSHVSARRYHGALGWRSTVAVGDSNNQPVALTLGSHGAGTMVVGSTGTPTVQALHFR